MRGFRVESGVEVWAFRSRLILVNGVAQAGGCLDAVECEGVGTWDDG